MNVKDLVREHDPYSYRYNIINVDYHPDGWYVRGMGYQEAIDFALRIQENHGRVSVAIPGGLLVLEEH